MLVDHRHEQRCRKYVALIRGINISDCFPVGPPSVWKIFEYLRPLQFGATPCAYCILRDLITEDFWHFLQMEQIMGFLPWIVGGRQQHTSYPLPHILICPYPYFHHLWEWKFYKSHNSDDKGKWNQLLLDFGPEVVILKNFRIKLLN